MTASDAAAGRGPSIGFMPSADGSIRLDFRKTTLDSFAKALGVDLARPVVNTTGLEGLYDIAFECSMDSVPGVRMGAAAANPSPAPSIFAALRDLGLELVSQSVPVKRLVVDSAQKVPTPN